jgi:hypothetical protein
MDIIANYGTLLVLTAAAVGFFMAYGIVQMTLPMRWVHQ